MKKLDVMPSEPKPVAERSRILWVSLVLFAFAAVLAINPLPFASPLTARVRVPAWATDTMPVRQPSRTPKYSLSVFTYRCSDCHRIIPSPPQTQRTLTQHTEIHLEHGINTRCFNCHHPRNRDAFVDDFGDEIPWDQPQLLCAKCHGPVYRDWQHGSHGRTNGHWLTTRGTRVRRKCIECHDPHQPPFPSLHPAPAPNTLRMGRQDYATHSERHDPLRLSLHEATIGADVGSQKGP